MLASALAMLGASGSTAGEASPAQAAGEAIAFDRDKGNCLVCHAMAGGDLPGNAGPPLADIQTRFPDRAALRARIYDARKLNPESIMPPYGRNGLLSADEIDLVVDFVWSL